MNTPKEKSLSELTTAQELQAGINEYFASESDAPVTIMPGGLAADAKPKDIDAAGEKILQKANHLLTAEDQAYLQAEAVRILKQGW